jgi:hypothetical protein
VGIVQLFWPGGEILYVSIIVARVERTVACHAGLLTGLVLIAKYGRQSIDSTLFGMF